MFSLDDIEFNFECDNLSSSINEMVESRSSTDNGNIFRKPHNSNIMSSKYSDNNTRRKDAEDSTVMKNPPLNINNRVSQVKMRSKDSSKITVKRKFPGPAGLLPDKPHQSLNSRVPEIAEFTDDNICKENDVLCSQGSELAFLEPPFKKLREDFDMERNDSPLKKFTIDWVKKSTLSKSLKGQRIPFLALVLLSIDCSSADPVLTLRDPTGELNGVLHRDVWKEMGEQLRPGAAMVVKEVGVLSTGVSRRQVMVNITKNNLVTIYCPCEEAGVIVNSVQPTSNADVLNSIREWQAKTVNSSSPTSLRSRQISPISPKALPNLFPNFTSTPSTAKEPVNYNKRVTNEVKSQTEQLNESYSNFDLFLENIEVPILNKSEFSKCNVEGNKRKNVISRNDNNFKPTRVVESNSIILSQAETSMLDEVLSGVDLDDFDQI